MYEVATNKDPATTEFVDEEKAAGLPEKREQVANALILERVKGRDAYTLSAYAASSSSKIGGDFWKVIPI